MESGNNLEQTNENSKVVLYGDSVGCKYKLKVRANTYAALFARRLNKPVELDFTSGANSTLVLNILISDEVKIGHLKEAEIVILSVGGNNVLVAFLMAMTRALDLGPLGAKTMNQIAQKFKSDKLAAPKILKELLGKKTTEDATAGVELFRKEFPAIIAKIRQLNPNAIILVHNVYNPFNTVNSKIYRQLGKPMGKYMDILNEIIAENQAEFGYLLTDLETMFKSYKGDEDLTHIKNKDMHLTDFGHITIYRALYDTLISAYPEYACEEHSDVIKTLEDLSDEEKEEQINADIMTKVMTEGGDEATDSAIQPDDFSSGEFDQYNEWFTGEAGGLKFYPLQKVEIAILNTDAADALAMKQSVFFKVRDGAIIIFGQDGVDIGTVVNEPVDDSRPTIAFSVGKNFPNSAKVFSKDGKLEILYAIYPTREYYTETMRNNK